MNKKTEPKKKKKKKKKKTQKSGYNFLIIIFLLVIVFISGWISGREMGHNNNSTNLLTSEIDHFDEIKPDYADFDAYSEVVTDIEEIRKIESDAPLLAIVIDDCGYGNEAEDILLNLNYPLNFAILPGLRRSAEFSKKAFQAGHEILLHQPMETHQKNYNPGPGAIYCKMGGEDVKNIIEKNLLEIKYATGMNNHTGSLFTESEKSMKYVVDAIKSKGMYFLDSRTSVNTVAEKIARENGIRAIRRRIFIDNKSDKELITKNIRKAFSIAQNEKWAVAIGHARIQTALALQELIPEIEKSEVKLVYLTEIFDRLEEK